MPPRRADAPQLFTKDLGTVNIKNSTAVVPLREPTPEEEKEALDLLGSIDAEAGIASEISRIEFRNVFVAMALLKEVSRLGHYILNFTAARGNSKQPSIVFTWSCSRAGKFRAHNRAAGADDPYEAHPEEAGTSTKKTNCPVRFTLIEHLPGEEAEAAGEGAEAVARKTLSGMKVAPEGGAHNHPLSAEVVAAEEVKRGVLIPQVIMQIFGGMLPLGLSARQWREAVQKIKMNHDLSPSRIANLAVRVNRALSSGKVLNVYDITDDDVPMDELTAFFDGLKRQVLEAEHGDVIDVLEKLAQTVVGFRYRLLTETRDGVEVLKAFSFSTAHQRTMFIQFGQLLHVDATHNVNDEGWPLTALCVKTSYGRLAAVSYCFAGNDFAHDVQQFVFESLVDMCVDDYTEQLQVDGVPVLALPRHQLVRIVETVMSDEAYDQGIMQGVFPLSRQRYCSFHFIERMTLKMMRKDTSKDLLRPLIFSSCSRDTFDKKLAAFEAAEPALVAHMRERGYLDDTELKKWAGMYLDEAYTAGVSANSLSESFNAMLKSFANLGKLPLGEVVLRALAVQHQYERGHQRLIAVFKLTDNKAAATPFQRDLAANVGSDGYEAINKAHALSDKFHSSVTPLLSELEGDADAVVTLRNTEGVRICNLGLRKGGSCGFSTNWLLPCPHLLCVLSRLNNGLSFATVAPYIHERWVLSRQVEREYPYMMLANDKSAALLPAAAGVLLEIPVQMAPAATAVTAASAAGGAPGDNDGSDNAHDGMDGDDAQRGDDVDNAQQGRIVPGGRTKPPHGRNAYGQLTDSFNELKAACVFILHQYASRL